MNKVRALRLALNMTQKEYAESIGVSVNTIHGWEQDKRRIPALKWAAMYRVLEENSDLMEKYSSLLHGDNKARAKHVI